jgi:hypothetical protein
MAVLANICGGVSGEDGDEKRAELHNYRMDNAKLLVLSFERFSLRAYSGKTDMQIFCLVKGKGCS